MKILIAGELNLDLILQNYRSFPVLGREVLVEDVTLTMGSASAICAHESPLDGCEKEIENTSKERL